MQVWDTPTYMPAHPDIFPDFDPWEVLPSSSPSKDPTAPAMKRIAHRPPATNRQAIEGNSCWTKFI